MNAEGISPIDQYEAAEFKHSTAEAQLNQSQVEMDLLKEQAQYEGETINAMIDLKTEELGGDVGAAKNSVLGGNRAESEPEAKIPETDLSEVKTFSDLYARIYQNGGLPASFGDQGPEYWVDVIEKVRAGDRGFEVLTSASGLRAKVQELLGQ